MEQGDIGKGKGKIAEGEDRVTYRRQGSFTSESLRNRATGSTANETSYNYGIESRQDITGIYQSQEVTIRREKPQQEIEEIKDKQCKKSYKNTDTFNRGINWLDKEYNASVNEFAKVDTISLANKFMKISLEYITLAKINNDDDRIKQLGMSDGEMNYLHDNALKEHKDCQKKFVGKMSLCHAVMEDLTPIKPWPLSPIDRFDEKSLILKNVKIIELEIVEKKLEP